ncbi:hypothetical protein MACH10_31110 [Thalassospira tepidiphila]|nr:hypothetical protein MACH10_31110 [Thalassospira tepidiphila]
MPIIPHRQTNGICEPDEHIRAIKVGGYQFDLTSGDADLGEPIDFSFTVLPEAPDQASSELSGVEKYDVMAHFLKG